MNTLYRFYNSNRDLLYVGITKNVETRFSDHKRSKPWDEIATITLQHFSTRSAASKAEIRAIAAEKPRWNIQRSDLGIVTTDPQADLIGRVAKSQSALWVARNEVKQNLSVAWIVPKTMNDAQMWSILTKVDRLRIDDIRTVFGSVDMRVVNGLIRNGAILRDADRRIGLIYVEKWTLNPDRSQSVC